MAGEFREQRQGRAPRSPQINNKYQAQNKAGRSAALVAALLGSAAGAHEGRPYESPDHPTKQNPARFPGRAQIASFNFTNNLICRLASTPE
jgi:hypothetical protein